MHYFYSNVKILFSLRGQYQLPETDMLIGVMSPHQMLIIQGGQTSSVKTIINHKQQEGKKKLTYQSFFNLIQKLNSITHFMDFSSLPW